MNWAKGTVIGRESRRAVSREYARSLTLKIVYVNNTFTYPHNINLIASISGSCINSNTSVIKNSKFEREDSNTKQITSADRRDSRLKDSVIELSELFRQTFTFIFEIHSSLLQRIDGVNVIPNELVDHSV
jgi:hypothetical protein